MDTQKGSEKGPDTSDSAGGSAQGARPLGTPKLITVLMEVKHCTLGMRIVSIDRIFLDFCGCCTPPVGVDILCNQRRIILDARLVQGFLLHLLGNKGDLCTLIQCAAHPVRLCDPRVELGQRVQVAALLLLFVADMLVLSPAAVRAPYGRTGRVRRC